VKYVDAGTLREEQSRIAKDLEAGGVGMPGPGNGRTMHAIAPAAAVATAPTRNALQLSLGDLPTVTFEAHHVFFSPGDEPDCLYVIVGGKVKIGRTAPDGRTCTFTVLGPGDVFGDVSLLDLGPRTATAVAMTEVRATPMNRTQLLRRLAAEPSAAEDLLRVMARRVRRGSENVVDLMSSDVPARICRHLLRLAQQFGVQVDGGVLVELDLNQEQFAQMVGTCRETVNKTLAELVAAGWIRIDREAIFIVESQPLMHRADGVQGSDRPGHWRDANGRRRAGS
jgi:CRP-like cAMP-binding protein